MLVLMCFKRYLNFLLIGLIELRFKIIFISIVIIFMLRIYLNDVMVWRFFEV